MRERRFSDSRYVFEQKVPARQERDQAHFDHLRFTLDHPRNILLDSLNGFCWIHIGLRRGRLLENSLVIRHRRSLTKGLETVNYSSVSVLIPESLQDAQKGCPARPQRAKWRGVRFGTLSL